MQMWFVSEISWNMNLFLLHCNRNGRPRPLMILWNLVRPCHATATTITPLPYTPSPSVYGHRKQKQDKVSHNQEVAESIESTLKMPDIPQLFCMWPRLNAKGQSTHARRLSSVRYCLHCRSGPRLDRPREHVIDTLVRRKQIRKEHQLDLNS